MTKTVMITGGTGFIGSHVIESLLNNKNEVILIKRSFSDIWRINNFLEDIRTYDIDKIPLQDAFKDEDIDGILHLATYYTKKHSINDISPLIQSNVEFPSKLLDLATENNLDFFINTGTFSEYAKNPIPLNENSKIIPSNLYSATKGSFENILKTYSFHNDIKSATLRLFSPYGPRDDEMKIIPYLIINALKNNSVKLSQGLQKLDFVYVMDIANAYLKTVELINNFDEYNTFNIGGGFPYSIRDIVSIIEELSGCEIDKRWGSLFEEPSVIYSDINKTKELLDWSPSFSIHQGLSETIKYYRDKYDL
ncbi:MAG: NAD(P)-dependent oxidoreductase [Methanobacteriales archaeon HGW-Methanobacteriales-1]|jgi:nucleoside-diphosphate-sugar epimerase|nr:MAG: NAD(P)-dependent oxidoreductase [Methanobacteriales archaeon HGW-Methanobacteriales-1]